MPYCVGDAPPPICDASALQGGQADPERANTDARRLWAATAGLGMTALGEHLRPWRTRLPPPVI
jgi:hypothetical protein